MYKKRKKNLLFKNGGKRRGQEVVNFSETNGETVRLLWLYLPQVYSQKAMFLYVNETYLLNFDLLIYCVFTFWVV